MKPSISVIISCYNYGQYLKETIKSVLGQTYQPFEVVVVDDGSTDNTPDVVASFGDDLVYIRQANSGVVAAKNCGASNATGDFILFVDADDVLQTDCLEKMAQQIERYPDTSFVYSDMVLFGARGGYFKAHDVKSYYWRNLMFINSFINQTALLRRSDFEEVGGLDNHLSGLVWEDWDLWLSLIERQKRARYINQPLLKYRQHTSKTSRNDPERMNAKGLQAEAYIRAKHAKTYSSVGFQMCCFIFRLRRKVLKVHDNEYMEIEKG